MLSDFGEDYSHVPLMCDSTSALSVAKNPVLHCDNPILDNFVLSPKPLYLVIKR
jgi:hypothetical protein